MVVIPFFFFSSRRRHTRYWRDWSSDVCSSDLMLQDARGRWYCNIVCEVEIKPLGGNAEVGVDLGLKSVAKCSDGPELERATFYRDLEPKLAEAQRRKRKRQVRTIHAKIANRRKDSLHKFSRALVKRARSITVGNVSASTLAKTP